MNKKVSLLENRTNEIIVITMVEEKNKDLFDNKISIDSHLGKALCKTSVVNEFEIRQGDNTVKYVLKMIFQLR